MRIRRRATVALPHAQAPSSPSFHPRSSPAPSRATSAPCSETAAVGARWKEPPASEVDRTMCQAARFDPRPLSRGGDRQEAEKEESAKDGGNGKRGEEDGRGEKTAVTCKKGDGKGWHCKREAQCGYSLCQYHLDKVRSYACYSQRKKRPKTAPPVPEKSSAAGIHSHCASQQEQNENRRRRRRTVEDDHVQGASTSGPGDVSDSFYYYYSGFGPQWGKRRGDRSVDRVKLVVDMDACASRVLLHRDMDAGASAAGGEREEEEEEEGEYDGERAGGEGRRLKCRALSSLL